MSRSKIKAVAPFLLRVWEKQTRKKYRSRQHWPEFAEFWDNHCGPAGHAWETVAADTEECFDCGQQRDLEPIPEPFIDDEFKGCPGEVPVQGRGEVLNYWRHKAYPGVAAKKPSQKKSWLAKIKDWAIGKRK